MPPWDDTPYSTPSNGYFLFIVVPWQTHALPRQTQAADARTALVFTERGLLSCHAALPPASLCPLAGAPAGPRNPSDPAVKQEAVHQACNVASLQPGAEHRQGLRNGDMTRGPLPGSALCPRFSSGAIPRSP